MSPCIGNPLVCRFCKSHPNPHTKPRTVRQDGYLQIVPRCTVNRT